jgi:uncharacterized protein (TIGR00369 family)
LTSDPQARAGVPRYEIAPHNCFACGALNTSGLQLQLHVEPRRSWTELTLERPFEGWDSIAHGGIVCTILDEVMAWSLASDDAWGVTARMSVTFRRPVRIGRRVRAEGQLARLRRRLAETEGRIVDVETGEELASATGLYVSGDETRRRELRERYGFRLVPEEVAP